MSRPEDRPWIRRPLFEVTPLSLLGITVVAGLIQDAIDWLIR